MANEYQDRALAAARKTLKDTEPMAKAAAQVRRDTAKPAASAPKVKPTAKPSGMRGYVAQRNRAISDR
jgi:hypothetical protein